MTRPLVSILTPTFNRASFLPETLDSLLGQSYPHLEVVVVDDGSTDDTAAVLADYQARWGHQLQCVRHDNVGQPRSINRAFTLARGDFFCIVNSDDPQPQGLLEPLVDALLAEPDVVLAYPDYDIIDEHGHYIHSITAPEFDYLNMVRWADFNIGPGALFRRTMVERIGGWNPEFRSCPDLDWLLRAGLVGPFKRVPGRPAHFRHHDGSITVGERNERSARERVRMMEQFFERTDLPDTVRAVRAESMRNTYVVASFVVDTAMSGAGARFQIQDRLSAMLLEPERQREPASETPFAKMIALGRKVTEQADTARWLHDEVAARDATIAWLHREVAERDKTIVWLHGEVAARDAALSTLRSPLPDETP